MDYDSLLYEKEEGIATITLNAPDKMNSLSAKMQKSIALVASEAAKDDEVKAVILTGAGRAFCAGGDMGWLKSIAEGTLEETRFEHLKLLGQGWADAFPGMDKPVIAAINGVCVGAGLSLALSCDIRLASEQARFGAGFINVALVPDCGMSYFLPRVTGTAKALELMLTGDIINAAEAGRLGIVSKVVPPEVLLVAAREMATRIAQQPPMAVELTKRLVYRSMLDDIRHHFDWETHAQQLCLRTEDLKESVRAFLEKRPRPKYRGK